MVIQAFTTMTGRRKEPDPNLIPESTPECKLMSCTYAAKLHENMGAAEVPSSVLLSLVLNLLSSLFKC